MATSRHDRAALGDSHTNRQPVLLEPANEAHNLVMCWRPREWLIPRVVGDYVHELASDGLTKSSDRRGVFARIIEAGHQAIVDAECKVGPWPVVRQGRLQSAERRLAIHRHDPIPELIIGSVQAHAKVHALKALLLKPRDSIHAPHCANGQAFLSDGKPR